MRLYTRICNLLGLQRIFLSKKLTLLLDNNVFREDYKNIVTNLLSCYILLSGIFVNLLFVIFSSPYLVSFKDFESLQPLSDMVSIDKIIKAIIFNKTNLSIVVSLVPAMLFFTTFSTLNTSLLKGKDMLWWGVSPCMVLPIYINLVSLFLKPGSHTALIIAGLLLYVPCSFFILTKLRQSILVLDKEISESSNMEYP